MDNTLKDRNLYCGSGIPQLYCDARLWNVERYVLTDDPRPLMLVPDEIRKCVVFVGYKNTDGIYELAGTAFYVARPIEGTDKGFTYLVTAKHIIDKIRDKRTDKVCLRVNFKDGGARWIETDIDRWMIHPHDTSVDVAVFRGGLSPEFDHFVFPMSSIMDEDSLENFGVGVGDEVFLTGLFANHHGQQRNIPIIRVGNIAAMPEEPVEVRGFGLIDAYLVEARSIGGISGSPVFVNIPLNTPLVKSEFKSFKEIRPQTIHSLIGLIHGHYDIPLSESDVITEDALLKKGVNMGIAIVVPINKILEVLDQPMIKKEEKELERKFRERQLPTPDSLETEPSLTQEGFEEALRRSSRKIENEEEEK